MRGWRVLAAVVVASTTAVVAASEPVAADIASVSPASATIEPGGSTVTTVRVQAAGFTCVSAKPSSPALTVSLSRECADEGSWSTGLTVRTDPDIPAGTYTVRVADQESGDAGSKTFTLRVQTATTTTTPTTTTPTTTIPTTTSTAAPTTTTTAAPTTTTSSPVTTTVPVTTTTTPPTTTTIVAKDFAPIASLVGQTLPEEGVFLPLLGEGYRQCLPLTQPCGGVGSGIVLLPARTSEVRWLPRPEGSPLPAPAVDLRGVGPIVAIGTQPEEPQSTNFALGVLDLAAPGGQLRILVRAVDDRGAFGVPSRTLPFAVAVVEGQDTDLDDTPSAASAPFGRPSIVRGASLTEAAPVLVAFAASDRHLIYGLRVDPAWGLDVAWLPFFADTAPFVARQVDGPPGLFVARPAGLRIPDAGGEGAATGDVGATGGGVPIVVWLAIAVTVAAAVVVAVTVVQRRRRPSDENVSTPRGTSR
jgi:hypothetical protein